MVGNTKDVDERIDSAKALQLQAVTCIVQFTDLNNYKLHRIGVLVREGCVHCHVGVSPAIPAQPKSKPSNHNLLLVQPKKRPKELIRSS